MRCPLGPFPSLGPVRIARSWQGLVVALALGAGISGCGGSGGEGGDAPPPPARPEDFPTAGGRSLAEIRKAVGEEGPVLAPSVSQFEPGRNRFGFGLFDRSRAQIGNAPVALYFAPVGGGPARGPVPARYESLAVDNEFQSRSVASDPDSAKSLYVAPAEFSKPGSYEVLGVARLDGRLVAAGNAGGPLTVSADGRVPEVGERAPRISTPTETDVGGDLEKIDTRQPPSTMHDADFADVVGKKPTLLLFATPALCQSRVCGPVVDIAEQVKAKRGDRVAFIHQEIFRDNEVDKGFRPQVLAWKLPTEPWAFAIDSRGRVAARIEGAFSAAELERAVDAAVGGA
jgi:hypothetical protein